jgi:hypothetical protein
METLLAPVTTADAMDTTDSQTAALRRLARRFYRSEADAMALAAATLLVLKTHQGGLAAKFGSGLQPVSIMQRIVMERLRASA